VVGEAKWVDTAISNSVNAGLDDAADGIVGTWNDEDRRRTGGYEFVAGEDKLGVETVAGGFIDGLAGEMAVEFVFVAVVAAEDALLAIGASLVCSFIMTSLAVLQGWPGPAMKPQNL